MRIPDLFHYVYVVELDVQVLIDAFQGAADGNVVLEFNGNFVVDEGLEKAVGGALI